MTQAELARRNLWRRRVLAVAAGFFIVAVLLAVSGGFRVAAGGLRLSARSPLPAAAFAVAALAVWYVLARRSRSVSLDLDAAFQLIERRSSIVTVAIAIASGLAALLFGTSAASGADASGYLSEAKLLADGGLAYRDTLASIVGGWQTGLTSPLGWRPGVLEGLQSPTYPPGLPLLMTIPHWAGGATAAGWVIAVSATTAVWSTGAIAKHLAGGVAAIVAAVVFATLPVFIYQSVQPMSDVPVTAAWMVCWWLLVMPGSGHRAPGSGVPAIAGVTCAIAVIIRPNLAPLAIVPLVFLMSARLRDAIAFAVPVALAAFALMWAQWQWYGSPLRSGYGTLDELFAVANIAPNARFYTGAVMWTAPILLLAPVGAVLVKRDRRVWALLMFAALVVASYLTYAYFDQWSYLRFLLPALAVGAILVGAALARMAAGLPVSARAAVTLAASLGVAAAGLANARTLDAFALKDQHRRVVQLGEHLNTSLPADAVIVAGEQSGSMRYYTSRPVLRWDAASPDDMTRALMTLRAANRPVWFVLDAWELEPFRVKYAGVRIVLDWPPAVTAGTTHRTIAWQLSDRERFSRGDNPPTLRLP